MSSGRSGRTRASMRPSSADPSGDVNTAPSSRISCWRASRPPVSRSRKRRGGLPVRFGLVCMAESSHEAATAARREAPSLGAGPFRASRQDAVASGTDTRDMSNHGYAARRARRLQDVGVRRWRMADRRSARPRPQFEIVGRARLAPGVVVWARVPYADRDDYKIRPAAVVDVVGRRATVRPLTSAASRLACRLAEVEDLAAAGLPRASGFRRRSVAFDTTAILAFSGELAVRDRTFATPA